MARWRNVGGMQAERRARMVAAFSIDPSQPDRGRRRARLPALGWLWQPIAMIAVLGLVGGMGVVLARGQDDARVALEDRFQTRIDLTARFASDYDADVLSRELSVARRRLAAPVVSQFDFNLVVADFGFKAAVLLNDRGQVLQVFPARPALLGTVLTGTYDHLRRAVAGEPAISRVVASAAAGAPVVAFAEPFETAYGRRVLSGAFDVSTSPIAAYLENALPFSGAEVTIVDPVGALAATNVAGSTTRRDLTGLDPGLAAGLAVAPSGRYDRDGSTRWFTSSAVAGSPLRIIASVPESELYAPLAGTVQWLPWVVIIALAAGSLFTVRVIFALSASRAAYQRLSRTDPLTGASNRRELSAQAERLLLEAKRKGTPVAVLMLDLDHFKSVNDTFGHDAGDEVLRVITARMRHALRTNDRLGRWGGEEFVAVLPGTTLAQATLVGDRLRTAISATPVTIGLGQSRVITVSVGCAVTVDESIDGLIRRADAAMYAAKKTGDAVVTLQVAAVAA